MKRIVPFLAAAFLMGAPLSARAQNCGDGSSSVQAGFCAKQAWSRADAELNRLWKIVKPRADARGTGRALLQEQRAWLKRRDATCDRELQGGGALAPAFYWACMEELTLARNTVLRGLR